MLAPQVYRIAVLLHELPVNISESSDPRTRAPPSTFPPETESRVLPADAQRPELPFQPDRNPDSVSSYRTASPNPQTLSSFPHCPVHR